MTTKGDRVLLLCISFMNLVAVIMVCWMGNLQQHWQGIVLKNHQHILANQAKILEDEEESFALQKRYRDEFVANHEKTRAMLKEFQGKLK